MASAFRGAVNMGYTATDSPDLSEVTDMSAMFYNARAFDQDLNDWDVSSVTDMGIMFANAATFNSDISGWDVSSVTVMDGMFDEAYAFNRDLGSWNVSSVTNMGSMFSHARLFDQDLNDWNVSSVTSMSRMFNSALSFNGDISSWNVSSVIHMGRMFANAAAFNGDISGWNVSSVLDVSHMFNQASVFDQDISGWNVSSVTNMDLMFNNAHRFKQNLGLWYVVLDDTSISGATGTLAIRAQNPALDDQNPTYGLGQDGDSGLFVVSGRTLGLNSTVDYSGKTAYSVNITSTGAFGTGNNRMADITVTDANRNPVLATITPKTATEHEELSFAVTATDADNNPVTFSLAGTLLDGTDITSGGVFTWTPAENQDGIHTVTVLATDSRGGTHERDVTITVNEANEAPELRAIVLQPANELVQLTFTADADDGDRVGAGGVANTLMFSLDGTYPTGASITSGGVFTWTPAENQDGIYNVTVRVSDGRGGTDTLVVSITINEVNSAPTLNVDTTHNVDELIPLMFTATASDVDLVDGDANDLAISLDGTEPDGASITDGVFTWTPTEGQDGTHMFGVSVSDGTVSVSSDVTVTVNEVNLPPTADAGMYGPYGEGVSVTLDNATASDPDTIDGSPDPLTYLWVQTGGTSVEGLAGTNTASPSFTTPTVYAGQDVVFSFTVTDAGLLSAVDTVTIRINNDLNEPPVADAGDSDTVDESDANVPLDGTGSSDPNIGDGDTLTYMWSQTGGTPSVTLAGSGTATASFNAPVVAADVELTFTLNVTDARGGSDTDTVTITVRDSASNAPRANAGDDRDVNEKIPVTLNGGGSSDPNGDALTYSWSQTSGPDVTLSNGTDVTASFESPAVKAPTTLTFELTVDDGNEQDSNSVTITVLDNESDDPVAAVDAPTEADEGTTVTLNGAASSDPNNDTSYVLCGPQASRPERPSRCSAPDGQRDDVCRTATVTSQNTDYGLYADGPRCGWQRRPGRCDRARA